MPVGLVIEKNTRWIMLIQSSLDSIAYYGLGCALINQGSVPQRDGTLRKCTPNTLPGIPAVGGGGGGAPPRIRSVDRYKEFES